MSFIRDMDVLPPASTFEITIQRQCIDGLHVFSSKDLAGLYVTGSDFESAQKRVSPAIEDLLSSRDRKLYKVKYPISREIPGDKQGLRALH